MSEKWEEAEMDNNYEIQLYIILSYLCGVVFTNLEIWQKKKAYLQKCVYVHLIAVYVQKQEEK